MAAALGARFGVEVTVDDGSGGDRPADADLLIHVIGAQIRSRDRARIDAATGPLVVVAGKADTRSDPQRLAQAAAADLGRPVFAVSGLLAGARMDDADLIPLRRWQRAGVRIPAAAAEFAAGDPADRDRARMMARFGRAGMIAVFTALAAQPDLTAAGLTEILRASSGVDALARPIAGSAGVIAERRRARRLHPLRLLAARGSDRARLEQRLIAESAQ